MSKAGPDETLFDLFVYFKYIDEVSRLNKPIHDAHRVMQLLEYDGVILMS